MATGVQSQGKEGRGQPGPKILYIYAYIHTHISIHTHLLLLANMQARLQCGLCLYILPPAGSWFSSPKERLKRPALRLALFSLSSRIATGFGPPLGGLAEMVALGFPSAPPHTFSFKSVLHSFMLPFSSKGQRTWLCRRPPPTFYTSPAIRVKRSLPLKDL